MPVVCFCTLLKTSENLWFSDVFSGYERASGMKWVKKETSRSSHLEVFCEKGVLNNFAIFTGKHLCWSLFLMKLQARPATLLKRDPNTGVFM